MILTISSLLLLLVSSFASTHTLRGQEVPSWLVNWPDHFRKNVVESQQIDVSLDPGETSAQEILIEREKAALDPGRVDGENIDVIEHFFWGKKGGMAIELGALDGSPATFSVTHVLESELLWKRIIIEGNPRWKDEMRKHSPLALAVSAAICEKEKTLHYADMEMVSGIVEFMSDSFLKKFFARVSAEKIPHDATSIDWESAAFSDNKLIIPISCIPLSMVLKLAKVSHVNFFMLDVEGGEMSVLKSIDWDIVTFDVIGVETDIKFRPEGYIDIVKLFMKTKGYIHHSDHARNSWFIHPTFIPSKRPGVDDNTWQGAMQLYTSRFRVHPLYGSISSSSTTSPPPPSSTWITISGLLIGAVLLAAVMYWLRKKKSATANA